MKKSQRLKTIVELNAGNEKKALEALAVVQQKKQALQTQLESLQEYQQDYHEQYHLISEKGVNISQLLEFRSFINKLELAIKEQQKAIVDMDYKLDSARKHWETQHQKTKSLEKVCQSALDDELSVENKREQKEQDERANRFGRSGGTRNA